VTTHVERSIEVEVPVRTVYDQWTQFEDFPRFMSGVQEVRQTGEALTHWVAEIGGVRREWDAAILEQVPDQKVAWAATTGATNVGAVYFTAVGAERTQVRLTLEFEPEGIIERIGDVLDIVDRQAVADLDRFKTFIESRGAATGGWRGAVDEGGVQDRGAGADAATVGAAAGGLAGGFSAGSADDAHAHSGRVDEADIPGDVVAVGPTGGTRSTVSTEEGSADTAPGYGHEGPGVGESGDPVAVDTQRSTLRTDSDDDESTGAAAGAGTAAGVAGLGTSAGLSSDDRASSVAAGDPGARGERRRGDDAVDPGEDVLTGYPGERTAEHTESGAEHGRTDEPHSGLLTGYPGARTPEHTHGDADDADESGQGFLTGYPGERTSEHTEAGTEDADESGQHVLTGYPGERTSIHGGPDDQVGSDELASDAVAGSWADDPGTGQATDAGTADDPQNPRRPSV
jgi:carbon monoxide dehydrogenase subunit G